jgi:hypothetical protein
VQYEVDTNDFRQQCEQYGEVKEFFDAVRRRGMVFVTYVGFFRVETRTITNFPV